MDFDEDTEVDLGIEMGDLVLVETESTMLAGYFTAVTNVGFHIRVTHELGTVQDRLSEDSLQTIHDSVAQLGSIDLLRLGTLLKVSPWAFRREWRLAEAVESKLVEAYTPAPREVLKQRAHPIRKIVPMYTLVSVELFEDWESNNTLDGLDFEADFDPDEELVP